jgi:vacuolar protein sorting-associated protein 54
MTTNVFLRAGLGNHLRTMNHSTFLLLIRSIYNSLLNCVEGLQSQSNIIVDLLSGIQSVCPCPSTYVSTNLVHRFSSIPALQEELSDILSSAAELCNTRAASIISMRSEEHIALEFPEFLEFFNESWSFVVKCEILCRRMIVGLRGVAVGQVYELPLPLCRPGY